LKGVEKARRCGLPIRPLNMLSASIEYLENKIRIVIIQLA